MKETFKIDWRISGLIAVMITVVGSMVTIGAWAGGVETRLKSLEGCSEKISNIASDVAAIKGYLEGRK